MADSSPPWRLTTPARLVIFAVTLLACCYYLWAVRATGTPFHWGYDLNGFYNLLGRGFAAGQLHLPVDPRRELLSLPDPWDPQINGPWKLHDAVLFNNRYYLYHGAGPALLLFAPWRLLTGHDLPENFAVFVFAFGTYICWAAALIRILALADARPPAGLLAVMLTSLAFCHGIPYLLNRVWVYEVAIVGGAFCVAAASWCLTASIEARRPALWLAASGLLFGLAIACRPHLALAGAIAAAGLFARLGWRFGRQFLAFVAPLLAAAAMVAWYNYARFGDPLEFGIAYLLAGDRSQQRVRLAAENVLPGMYYMLWCAPAFSTVFPWITLALRKPFDLPEHYFIEPAAGVLYVAPVVVFAVLLPLIWPGGSRRLRAILTALWTFLISALAILLFVTATGFTTQRYETDFLPPLVFTGVAVCAILLSRTAGATRAAMAAALVGLCGYSLLANLALGITGPYDEVLKNRARSYLRIANWFTPADNVRLLLNPDVSVDLGVQFDRRDSGFREPLLTAGRQVFRHFLYVEHASGKLRIRSETDESSAAAELTDVPGRPVVVSVRYAGASELLTVSIDGNRVLEHEIGTLVTAPAQVTPGENRIDPNRTGPRFTGKLKLLGKLVTRSPTAAPPGSVRSNPFPPPPPFGWWRSR